MLNCLCPTPASLTTVPYDPCYDVFGKDARWIFQRLDDASNTFVDGTNGIELEASWTALPNASDNTKVVITPQLEAVSFGESGKLEDDENIDGAPNYVGAGPQLVTATIRNPTPEQYAALKDLECERNLTLYRIDNLSRFGARLVGADDHAGIRISVSTFAVLGPAREGTRADREKIMIQFYVRDEWYETFRVVAPAAGFDPLTEIRP